jgi:Nickel responsive protein SCO4226-like
VATEAELPLFMVEHDLNGLSPDQLASAHQALGEAVRREARRGGQIRYVQRVLASAERKCLGLFEAPGPGLVRRVHDTAQFPLVRILAVTSSPPPGGDRTADPEEGQPDDSR